MQKQLFQPDAAKRLKPLSQKPAARKRGDENQDLFQNLPTGTNKRSPDYCLMGEKNENEWPEDEDHFLFFTKERHTYESEDGNLFQSNKIDHMLDDDDLLLENYDFD
jgi:hypothetical protein